MTTPTDRNPYADEDITDAVLTFQQAAIELRENPPKHRFTNAEIVVMFTDGKVASTAGYGNGGKNENHKGGQ